MGIITSLIEYYTVIIPKTLKLRKRVKGNIYIDHKADIDKQIAFIDESSIDNADIINMCGGIRTLMDFTVINIADINDIRISDITTKLSRGIDRYHKPYIVFRYKEGDYLTFDILYMELNDGKWRFKGNQISIGYDDIDEGYGFITERLYRLLTDKRVGYYTTYDGEDLSKCITLM